MRLILSSLVASSLLLFGCSGGSGDDGSGGGPSEGSGAGGGSSTGTGGTAAGQELTYVAAECEGETFSCNGECLAVGESRNGCTIVTVFADAIFDGLIKADGVYSTTEKDYDEILAKYDRSTGARVAEYVPTEGTTNIGAFDAGATQLAWIEWTGSTQSARLVVADKTGGTGTVLIETAAVDSLHALDDGWLIGTSTFANPIILTRLALDGTGPLELGEVSAWAVSPTLRLDDGVVFASGGGDGFSDLLRRVPLDGTESTILAESGSLQGVGLSGDHVYFFAGSYASEPMQLARVPRTGGDVERLGSPMPFEEVSLNAKGDSLFVSFESGKVEVFTTTGEPRGDWLVVSGNVRALTYEADAASAIVSEIDRPTYLVRVEYPQ